ncbi:MAG: DUF2808 domain-containing protein [Synechococcales bacterium]|nr:DUF2808 domain-containing protein [Synechococcales bacterium]
MAAQWLKQTGWITVLASGLALGWHSLGQAVQLANGQVYFDRPPRLVDSSVLRDRTAAPNVGYFFSLEVPADAGEPLQSVAIAQRDGETFTREIEYELDETEAFVGTRRRRGADLPVATTTWDDETNTAVVTFDPPVPPGTDLTIRLEAERNPRRSGIYLFGITAYPAGADPYGQFLGYGRLHFYDSGNDSIFDSRWQGDRPFSIH